MSHITIFSNETLGEQTKSVDIGAFAITKLWVKRRTEVNDLEIFVSYHKTPE